MKGDPMQTPVHDYLAPRHREIGPEGAPEKALDHWRLTRDDDNVAWLVLDREGESANSISAEVLDELDKMLGHIEEVPPKGVVLRSGKPGAFIVGADVREFRGATDAEEVERRITRAHEVVDRLARLSVPTVALIHGHCLGGGLEVALACDYRVAIAGASLGFPEVLLGLHPGLGGTFRLTGLIDPVEAMTMMLTGKPAHAAKAKKLGLVDAVVEWRHAEAAVRAAIQGEIETDRGGLRATALGTRPARHLAARQMRSKARERAGPEHYPAPYALIDLWEEHGGDRRAMQEAEIRSFSRLMAGDTAQNLIRVFFLREALKAEGREDAGIAHVHVIGAGQMGGDIAAWCAMKGLRVTLADLDAKALARAVGRASELCQKRLHDRADRRDALDRLVADFRGSGLGAADLVIEAIAEKADAKLKLYGAIAPRMKDGAILATNTSSLPLETLREGLPWPDRFVGLHFFNPVAKMELVEVVSHDGASEATLARARGFCGDIARLPVPVTSAPGFLVNRVLTPYLLEALVLMEEGVDPATIDRAAEDFGMAMGPVEVADRVGLDVALEVADTLREALDQPMPEPPQWLRDKVEAGDLGRKTGKGLYEWRDDRPRKGEAGEADKEVTDRLILPMVNASAACLRQGVVRGGDHVDAAMIFGAGFAPFRGGPVNYARTRGVGVVRKALEELQQKHGARFRPDPGLDALDGDS